MTYWPAFLLFKLYSWAKRSAPNDPMPGVMMGVVFLSFCNVMTVLSTIHIALGRDVTAFMFWGGSRAMTVLLIFGPWTVLAYFLLKKFDVEARVSSRRNREIYEKRKYHGMSVIAYILISFALFVAAAWFEPSR